MRYSREVSATGTVTEYWWGYRSAPEFTRVTGPDGSVLREFRNGLLSTGTASVLLTPEQSTDSNEPKTGVKP